MPSHLKAELPLPGRLFSQISACSLGSLTSPHFSHRSGFTCHLIREAITAHPTVSFHQLLPSFLSQSSFPCLIFVYHLPISIIRYALVYRLSPTEGRNISRFAHCHVISTQNSPWHLVGFCNYGLHNARVQILILTPKGKQTKGERSMKASRCSQTFIRCCLSVPGGSPGQLSHSGDSMSDAVSEHSFSVSSMWTRGRKSASLSKGQ